MADEMQVNFEFLKFTIVQAFKLFVVFNNIPALLKKYECIQVGIFSKSLL